MWYNNKLNQLENDVATLSSVHKHLRKVSIILTTGFQYAGPNPHYGSLNLHRGLLSFWIKRGVIKL